MSPFDDSSSGAGSGTGADKDDTPASLPPYQRATTVPQEVCDAFGVRAASIERLGHGHINETFVVRVTDTSGQETRGTQASSPDRILFQAINHSVFAQPWQVMQNLERVLAALDSAPGNHLSLLVPQSGQPGPGARESLATIDECGRWWRAFPFIENSVARTSPRDAKDVYRTAQAFGNFQLSLGALDPSELHETIPKFHDTVHRYTQLDEAIETDRSGRLAGCITLVEVAERYRCFASRLLDLEKAGDFATRVVHNDAKISNVLFSSEDGSTKCVVDLDTVMPGLSLFDFGDMVRSMSHTSEEDEVDLTKVFVQPKLFEALAAGYAGATQDLLNDLEREHLLDAGLVLVLEQGVRFLADHLNGDDYFFAYREGHNLDRARTQFKLLESLLQQEKELRRLAKDASKTPRGVVLP